MSYEFLIGSIVDPDSYAFGAVTLIASIVTIAALKYTIKNVKESSEQFKLASQIRQLDAMFDLLESLIRRVQVGVYGSGSLTVIMGRDSIYYAVEGNKINSLIDDKPITIKALKLYFNRATVYSSAAILMINKIKSDETRNMYKNRFNLELQFIRDYIRPIAEHGIRKKDKFESHQEFFIKVKDFSDNGIPTLLSNFYKLDENEVEVLINS